MPTKTARLILSRPDHLVTPITLLPSYPSASISAGNPSASALLLDQNV